MSRIRRILFGEPKANKQWSVWYYDNSISSRILKFLFGIRGCYRIDADNINYRSQKHAKETASNAGHTG